MVPTSSSSFEYRYVCRFGPLADWKPLAAAQLVTLRRLAGENLDISAADITKWQSA